MKKKAGTEAGLRVCILTSQYFGPSKFGGFGTMSRALAEALAERKIPTSVIVPRRDRERWHENLGGVEIFRFPPLGLGKALSLLRASPATVFHSQDPTFLTSLARWARPDAAHVVTCRDPRAWRDWLVEFRHATWYRRFRLPRNWFLEVGPIVRWGVRRADAVYAPALFLREKARRLFRPGRSVRFLPNLIEAPPGPVSKGRKPVLTYLGRLDPRKRPELFLDLASHFPQAEFQVVGRAESPRRDLILRRRYGDGPNVRWVGFVDRFQESARMKDILSRTWILVSTSAREGLPLSFLESAAYECVIVSAVNPDDFAARFGAYVENKDFVGAISGLLSAPDALRSKGRRARRYVLSIHEKKRATQAHIEAYCRALEESLDRRSKG